MRAIRTHNSNPHICVQLQVDEVAHQLADASDEVNQTKQLSLLELVNFKRFITFYLSSVTSQLAAVKSADLQNMRSTTAARRYRYTMLR